MGIELSSTIVVASDVAPGTVGAPPDGVVLASFKHDVWILRMETQAICKNRLQTTGIQTLPGTRTCSLIWQRSKAGDTAIVSLEHEIAKSGPTALIVMRTDSICADKDRCPGESSVGALENAILACVPHPHVDT